MKRLWGFALIAVTGCGVFGTSDSSSSSPPTDGLPPDAPPPLDGTPVDDQLTEQFGVFVTPAGSDGGDGSRGAPYATIKAAIEAAKPSFKRVYVCTGTYKETIQLVSGISVIGGYDCADPAIWKSGAARSHVDAPASPAIEARNIDKTTRFEGFDVVAPDGSDASASSIALIAEKATALTIANGSLTAGRGHDGAAGQEGTQLTLPASATGANGAQDSGAFSPSMLLVIKRNAGAAGGSGACVGAPGVMLQAGGTGGYGGGYECTATGIGKWAIYTNAFGVAQDRSDGVAATGTAAVAGQDGASGTTTWQISAAGFTTSDGVKGKDGTPGKGGNGGNGANGPTAVACNQGQGDNASSGPGGGSGGCPGLAGTSGKGGGASIAAIVVGSDGITFDNVALTASDGGGGGKGTFGSQATAGGQPGTAYANAGAAAAGSPGGRAGVSGSGAGGPSFAIAYSGAAPKLTGGSTTKFGQGGAGVPADSKPDDGLGNARTLPASASGDAKDLFAF